MASGRVWSGLGVDARASQRWIVVSALPVLPVSNKALQPIMDIPRQEGEGRRTRNNHRVTFPRKLNRLDPRIMSAPPSSRHALLDIPQEYRAVPAYAREPRVVPRDCDVEHGVPVCFVPLDWTR